MERGERSVMYIVKDDTDFVRFSEQPTHHRTYLYTVNIPTITTVYKNTHWDVVAGHAHLLKDGVSVFQCSFEELYDLLTYCCAHLIRLECLVHVRAALGHQSELYVEEKLWSVMSTHGMLYH